MKKFILYTLILLFSLELGAIAEESDNSSSSDLWDNWNSSEYYQDAKAVSDKDFDKAIEQVDKKVNKWKNWANKKKLPKGEEFNQSNETEIINETYGENKVDPIISLPIDLEIGDGILPIGHYKVLGEKKDGKTFLKFYQAHEMIAKIQAIETDDDFDEDSISFVKWVAKGDDKLLIEFGSLDFNAYIVLKINQNNL